MEDLKMHDLQRSLGTAMPWTTFLTREIYPRYLNNLGTAMPQTRFLTREIYPSGTKMD